MNAEFFDAIADIEREKGIPQKYMGGRRSGQALLAAFKRTIRSARTMWWVTSTRSARPSP